MGARAAAVVAACMAVVAACGPGVWPVDASLRAGILTPDYQDRYELSVAGDLVTASAPASNQGLNTRVAFWRSAEPASADQQSCATWVDADGRYLQQGAALRIRSAAGRTSAITVTNNIAYGWRWVFNVHVMDSASSTPYRGIGQFSLDGVFRPGGPGTIDVAPYPWRMCARVVGSTLSFVVWPTATHAQPAWDDPRYGGSVTVPAGWEAPGAPGFYVGHLEAGDSVGFTALSTAVVSSQPSAASALASAGSTAVAPEPTTPPRAPTFVLTAP
jgi:hypothetical protein